MMVVVRLFFLFALISGCAAFEWNALVKRLEAKGEKYGLETVQVNRDGESLNVAFEVFGKKHEYVFQADTELFDMSSFKHQVVSVRDDSLHTLEEPVDCVFKFGSFLKGSRGFANTCGDHFVAWITTPDVQLRIEQIDGNKSGNVIKCLIYDTRVNTDTKGWSCKRGKGATLNNSLLDVHYSKRDPEVDIRALGASSSTKYVKMFLVNDYERYLEVGKNAHAQGAHIVQLTQAMYDVLNALSASKYRIQIQIVGMISFSHGNPWNLGLDAEGETNHQRLLEKFGEWRLAQMEAGAIPENGIGHLLSGREFDGTVVGLANLGTLCHSGYGVGVVQTSGYSDKSISRIQAHELAHNLGAYHTDEVRRGTLVPKSCSGDYLMNANGVGNTRWSDCTANWINMAFDGHPAGCTGSSCIHRPSYGIHGPRCADTRTEKVWTLSATCGNGMREAGEECDCGLDDCTGVDPCCNGATCKFVEGAVCSSNDPCCNDQCSIVPKTQSKVCRASVDSECDIPETCDGVSPQCPLDKHMLTGTACSRKRGACYAGSCQTHRDQCSQLNMNYIDCPSRTYNDGANACGVLYCLPRGSSRCGYITNKAEGGPIQVRDGTPCQGDASTNSSERKVCKQDTCVVSTELVAPVSIQCSNGILDEGETDVDCGGPCFPCHPKEKCIEDTDCFGTTDHPGLCDKQANSSNSFEEPPAGESCNSYENTNDCEQYSGCIWVQSGNTSKCKNTGLLPPSKDCSTQKVELTCINWQYCAWNETGQGCYRKANTTDPVYGTCHDYGIFNRPDNPEEADPFSSLWEKITNNLGIVIPVTLGAVSIGLCLVCMLCRSCSNSSKKTHKNPKTIQAHVYRSNSDLYRDPRAINPNATSFTTNPLYASGSSAGSVSSNPDKCPLCGVHYANPQNEHGLCNTCNATCFSVAPSPIQSPAPPVPSHLVVPSAIPSPAPIAPSPVAEIVEPSAPPPPPPRPQQSHIPDAELAML
mmetsp:Transcript_31100/g.49789  ORF Transcript_31100/g.49789 Transcript_31100/m.49789 type:complete len:983 (-) Transcript_31100:2126-5074(-)